MSKASKASRLRRWVFTAALGVAYLLMTDVGACCPEGDGGGIGDTKPCVPYPGCMFKDTTLPCCPAS